MEPDFSGWATKAGLKCSDGRTITKDAFAHQDKVKVPLVWQHIHNEPDNVLGHAILEHRDEGIYCYGYFNDTQRGQASKQLVQHGDVVALSIYANQLVEKAKTVLHGAIREVSLVLSGANPGALIDNVRLQHSSDPDDVSVLDEEAYIFTGLALEHSGVDDAEEDEEVDEEADIEEDDAEEDEVVEHADNSGDETVQDVYDTLSPKQKDVVNYMIGAALEQAGTNNTAEHSDSNDEGDLTHQEGTSDMSRNVFDQNGTAVDTSKRLTHSQLVAIVETAKNNGGHFKDAVLAHAQEYGIEDLNLLFPDAKALTSTPEFISRRMEWVAKVLDGTKHSPFAKVKTVFADITADEARAKGYIKGTRKVEEVFKLLQRTTGPTTIYKKQKLDRDDILDITDLDVVNWLKAEMRLMIEEELARAILVGDNRSSMNPDKVKDPEGAIDGTGIRSILLDDDLYTVKRELAANVGAKDAVKGIIRSMVKYKGSGSPTMFISRVELTEMLLEEDKFGRPLYSSRQALADAIGVSEIVTVDLFDEYDNLLAIIVNLNDYTVGSNRGGELTSFEDFDIDFNQNKYLQETRLSGGLTRPFSALVINRAQGTEAVPVQPSYDGATKTITIPTVTGLLYTVNGEEVTGEVGPITSVTEVEVEPETGYYIKSGTDRDWTYTP